MLIIVDQLLEVALLKIDFLHFPLDHRRPLLVLPLDLLQQNSDLMIHLIYEFDFGACVLAE